MKKLASLILAVVMVLSMTIAAFADETNKGLGNFTITLNNENAGHTYTAYQVFKGDLSQKEGKNTLSNIEWADGVSQEGLIAAIKACDSDPDAEDAVFAVLSDKASAREVAKVLASQTPDNEMLQKFVKAIRPFLLADGKSSVENKTVDNKFAGTYTISGLLFNRRYCC